MKITSKIFLISIFILSIATGCGEEPNKLPTKGYLKCFVDESLYNVINESAKLFMRQYPKTKIDLVVVSAREGIVKILNNEAELFISSRALNAEEENYVKKENPSVKAFKYCYDGIVVIANKNSNANKISLTEIEDGLTKKSNNKFILPEPNSGVYEFIKSQVLLNKKPIEGKIVKSENEVINAIKQNNERNEFGLVGYNTLTTIRDSVKILQVGESKTSGKDSYYLPHPGYFVNDEYPLRRTCIILINEVGLGVASGFASFITSSDGQKIVLKNNLGPATVPVRLKQSNG